MQIPSPLKQNKTKKLLKEFHIHKYNISGTKQSPETYLNIYPGKSSSRPCLHLETQAHEEKASAGDILLVHLVIFQLYLTFFDPIWGFLGGSTVVACHFILQLILQMKKLRKTVK